MSQSTGLSNFKSICVIIVVIGCFAILWPKVFYPMLMYGIRWDSRGSSYSIKDGKDDYLLPPKVREAMRSSPVIDNSKNTQKLPGRPQFYTSKREINTGSSQNSVWNILVPLYALILVIIFIYALFKLSLKDDKNDSTRTKLQKPPLHNPDECKDCRYDQIRKEYTNKRYDPYLSRSTYRTFDYYGRRNVKEIMHSLVEDVKKFREQLVKAQICQCKLAKYEKEFNEAKSFLNQMEQEEINERKNESEVIPDDENKSSTIVSQTKGENKDQASSSEEEQLLSSSSLVSIKQISETVQPYNQKDDQNDETLNDKENIAVNENIVKKRRKYLHKFKLKNKIFKNDSTKANKKDFRSSLDIKLIQRINQKFDKLMHAKEK